MNKYRKKPADDFESEKRAFDAGQMSMSFGPAGNAVVVTDPEYAASHGGVSFLDQMEQVRAMTPDQYDAAREALAGELSQQLQAFALAHPPQDPNLPWESALAASEDDLTREAIRRLFLQPDAVQFFAARQPRPPTEPARQRQPPITVFK